MSAPLVDVVGKTPEMPSVGLPCGDEGVSVPDESAKFSAPEKPSVGLDVSAPSVDIGGKTPERFSVDVPSGVDVSVPEVNVGDKVPVGGVNKASEMPAVDLSSGGGIGLSIADVRGDVAAPSVKVGAEVPEVYADVPAVGAVAAPDVNIPSAKVDATGLKGTMGDVTTELGAKLGSGNVTTDVKAPEMRSVSAPSVELPSGGEGVVVSAPDEKLEQSAPSVEGPKVGVEDMSAGMSGKVGGVNVDVKAENPDKPLVDVKEPRKSLLGRLGLGKSKNKVKAS